MKKELRRQRREAKRRRALERNQPDSTGIQQNPPAPTELKVPPEGVPILWVVPTGKKHCHRGHWCDACSTYTQLMVPLAEWDEPFPDPRPTIACRKCGAQVPMNSRGLDTEYHAPSTGEVFETQRDLPVGAVYEHPSVDGEYHNWTTNGAKGKRYIVHRPNEQDGRVLCCVLPDGHPWTIDSRANNCTLPDDDEHWCWVRHGRPEDGTLHVDKEGKTCSAGAGSIQTGRWHGFLRRGRLVQC